MCHFARFVIHSTTLFFLQEWNIWGLVLMTCWLKIDSCSVFYQPSVASWCVTVSLHFPSLCIKVMDMQPLEQMLGRSSACSMLCSAFLSLWLCSRAWERGWTHLSAISYIRWNNAWAFDALRCPWRTWSWWAFCPASEHCVWAPQPFPTLRDGASSMLTTTASSHSPQLALGTLWLCRKKRTSRRKRPMSLSALCTFWWG